jgi:hypothetical protein
MNSGTSKLTSKYYKELGAKGGRSKSAKKRKASSKNLAKARKVWLETLKQNLANMSKIERLKYLNE